MLPDDLMTRFERVEQLIETLGVGVPQPARAADEPPAQAAIRQLEAVAQRVRVVMAELETRRETPEWDSADTVVARLLLAELSDALGECRTVSRGVSQRLAAVHDGIREGRRHVDRHVKAAAAHTTPA